MTTNHEHSDNRQVASRQELRRARLEEQENNKVGKKVRKGRERLIPIWLRLVIIVLFLFLSLTVGLMVGYGVIGEGTPGDALQIETWLKLVDLVQTDTVE